ncbi:hypothetical protein ACFZBU_39760 [Embleya sp. NPDC008237]|uniref:hypothetical protein n=1 Tax=Embleya sp. NPDC008237 TaxID=3363978 RepID=UPI0036E74EFC
MLPDSRAIRHPHPFTTVAARPRNVAITGAEADTASAGVPVPTTHPTPQVHHPTRIAYEVGYPTPAARTTVPPGALGVAVGGLGIALALIGVATAIRIAGPGVEAAAHALWALAAALIAAAVLVYTLARSRQG